MNILQHKSYNPYSQKNREKVAKAERDNQVKEAEEREKRLEDESEARYKRLKRKLEVEEEVPEEAEERPALERFQLFEEERSVRTAGGKDKDKSFDEAFRLGHGADLNRLTWTDLLDEKKSVKKLKSEKRYIEREDPLNLVNQVLGKPLVSAQTSDDSVKNHASSPTLSTVVKKKEKKSIEELRKERLVREQLERKRTEQLIAKKK